MTWLILAARRPQTTRVELLLPSGLFSWENSVQLALASGDLCVQRWCFTAGHGESPPLKAWSRSVRAPCSPPSLRGGESLVSVVRCPACVQAASTVRRLISSLFIGDCNVMNWLQWRLSWRTASCRTCTCVCVCVWSEAHRSINTLVGNELGMARRYETYR